MKRSLRNPTFIPSCQFASLFLIYASRSMTTMCRNVGPWYPQRGQWRQYLRRIGWEWEQTHIPCTQRSAGCCEHRWLALQPCVYFSNIVCGPSDNCYCPLCYRYNHNSSEILARPLCIQTRTLQRRLAKGCLLTFQWWCVFTSPPNPVSLIDSTTCSILNRCSRMSWTAVRRSLASLSTVI